MKKTQYGDYATWVGFEIFAKYPVRVIFTNNLTKSSEERLGHTPDAPTDAFVFHVRKGMSYLFLPFNATEGMVAHEAWHIVNQVFHYVGIKDMEDEVVAYHLGYLISKIYEFKRKIKGASHDHRKRAAKPSKSRDRR